ncbi:multicopper oxidase family protein [Aquifex sp.]
MNRRELFKKSIYLPFVMSGINLLSACGGGGSSSDIQVSDTKNPLRLPQENGLLGYLRPQGRITIEASPSTLEIIKGKETKLLTYKVGNYENPIIVLKRGDTFSVDFVNKTGEESIIHWHGFRAHWRSDGHPAYQIGNGETYSYPDINIINRSGTYFYHPHPHGKTGYQVYMGLAGMIIIEDDDEDNLRNSLDLELGITDIPLIIQDKNFDSNGQLVYNLMGMNRNMGFWGETILVNLTPNPYLDVERRIYRFRILNGSNARPYRLVLQQGSQRMRFWVIGVEGGLLSAPRETSEIYVAPGERIDILVDFRDANVGDVIKMKSLPHNLVGMGGMMSQGSINAELEILEFRVIKDSVYDRQIPNELSAVEPIDTSNAKYIDVNLNMSMGGFNINGYTWDNNNPLKEYEGFVFNNGEIVVFRFINNTGMYHPMHIHGFQFQILSRSSGNLRDTDMGWKDTVIVAPHETVEIAVNMSHNFGEKQYYLFHCHILEHHDAGMMINYTVS